MKLRVQLALVLYVTSGWLTPLLVDELRISGTTLPMGKWPNLSPMLTNTLSMIVAWYCTPRSLVQETINENLHNQHLISLFERLRKPNSLNLWKRVVLIAFFDFMSGAMLILGQLEVGSSLFVVLYSSCTLWTALLSRIILEKNLQNTFQVKKNEETHIIKMDDKLILNEEFSELNHYGINDQISDSKIQTCNNKNNKNIEMINDENKENHNLSDHEFRAPLTLIQWFALIAITIALAGDTLLSMLFNEEDNNHDNASIHAHGDGDDNGISNTTTNVNFEGISLVLFGSMFHSVVFCLVELIGRTDHRKESTSLITESTKVHETKKDIKKLKEMSSESVKLSKVNEQVTSLDVCGFMGFSESVVLLIYHILVISISAPLPSDNSAFVSIHFTLTNLIQIAPRYMILLIVQSFHASSFFVLLESVGATTSGVLKGLQTVFVFVASGILFCSSDKNQCMTISKTICVIVVSISLVLYNYGKA